MALTIARLAGPLPLQQPAHTTFHENILASESTMGQASEEGNIATKERRHLPPEIWDMILYHLTICPTHRRACSNNLCLTWLSPPASTAMLPLRLVSRYFHYRLTPPLFQHMTAKSPRHRMRMLKHFTAKTRLTEHIRILRMEISPHDLGGKVRRVTQATNVSAAKKLLHYFEVLPEVLGPILKHYTRLKVLHVTTTYDGLMEKRLPKSELLPQCFEALCVSVRRAQLDEMEDIQLGMPYEGGYTTFFEDLEDQRYKVGLRGVGKGVKSAAIKLYDHQGNFTTMPFF